MALVEALLALRHQPNRRDQTDFPPWNKMRWNSILSSRIDTAAEEETDSSGETMSDAVATKNESMTPGKANGGRRVALPDAPARPKSYDKKVGLVLQGGGALGSYQAGIYEALSISQYVP